MIFIRPDAADAQRKQSDESEHNFDAGGDHAEVKQICEDVEDKDGALVLGIEFVVKGHGAAHRLSDFFVVAFIFHGNSIEVISVGKVAHGAERDVNFAVHVLVAVLNDVLEHADDFVGDSVDSHFFAERVLAGKQFFLHVGAEDGDAAARVFVEIGKETAVFDLACGACGNSKDRLR